MALYVVSDELDDAQLCARLAAGDEDALGLLYDRYGGLAYGVALRVVGDGARAEDVVQDVFVKLWTNARQFDANRGSVRTWLLTSVRNRAVDTLRGRGAHERREREIPDSVESSGVGSDPWREVSLGLDRDAVREAMASLPVDQRQVVELAYWGGYTQSEIAGLTRVPVSTVKGRMRLALEKLGSYLAAKGMANA